MKLFLLVLLLAAAGLGAYHFYLRDYLHDHPISLIQGPEAAKSAGGAAGAPTGKKDFRELDARLQGEMDRIPVNLRDARQVPNTAFSTKSQIAPYLGLHEEYVMLDRACELIIEADQNFLDHQQKCGLAPAGPGASVQERARAASAASSAGPALYQQQQTLWDSQRKQSDGKVRQLLLNLDTKRL